MWIALLLWGCTTTGVVTDPAPYVYDPDDLEPPEVDVEAIERGLDAFVDQVLALNAVPVLAAYEQALAEQDDYCPPWYTGEGGETYWFGQCTTDSGATFDGYGFGIVIDEEPQGDYLVDARGLFGVNEITTGDGEAFTAGGGTYWYRAEFTGEGDPHTVFYTMVQGAFGWTGQSAAGTWLHAGLAPDLEVQAYYVPAYDYHFLSLDGGVTGLDAEVDTVVADGLQIQDDFGPGSCSEEPGGMLSVRTPEGEWFDLLFDGPTEANPVVDEGDCDGCGAVYWRGTYQGEACGDFGALLGWEEAPW